MTTWPIHDTTNIYPLLSQLIKYSLRILILRLSLTQVYTNTIMRSGGTLSWAITMKEDSL